MKSKKRVLGVILGASACAFVAVQWLTNDSGEAQNLDANKDTFMYDREAKEEITTRYDNTKIFTTEDALKELAERPPEPATTEPDYDKSSLAWQRVDLLALQAEQPDNLFWLMAAPTQDPNILQQRADKREYLTSQETKIGTNQASETEIRDYYAFQQQLSNDYIEFTALLLKRYGDVIPEESKSMQGLAQTMHLSRLQEYPRQLTDALERRQAFDKQKSDWMADKEAYKARLEAQAAQANKALGKI